MLNKNITVENEEEIKNENEKNKENLNNNENNDVILKNTKNSFNSKKTKKKKKKKKKDKEKIEIFAQDKNKLKQIKLNSILIPKKIKNGKNEKKLKAVEKNPILNKISNPVNVHKSKSLSKSIKQIPNNLKVSVEIEPSKVIYENGVSDDEEEIKKK